MVLSVLRIALYVQLLLGLFRYAERFGAPPLGHIFDIHQLIGVIVVVLALYAFRSIPGVPNTGVRIAARFFAIVPLVLGLGFVATVIPTRSLYVGIHMLAGIMTIALVEMAIAQQRRARRRRRITG